jgi:hypothetical protein
MKKLISLFSFIAFFALAASSQPVMTFEKPEVDYGTIPQYSDPVRKIKFKNTGTAPLIIKEAASSCGCTIPQYQREPVMPGGVGEIEIRYETHRLGQAQKSITFKTNEPTEQRILVVKVNVVDKEEARGLGQKK